MKITSNHQKGFTLIELMIALSILSTILVMATVILTQIGKWYSKGVNAANLQNNSRNVLADISSALQFNGGSFQTGSRSIAGLGTVRSFCVNNARYSYVLNRELGEDQSVSPSVTTNHVLWRDTMKTTANCNPLDLANSGKPTDSDSLSPSDGYEMLGNHVRLTAFDIAEDNGIYSVTLNAAFGDSDLVVNNGGVANCRGGPGSEYCSASNLTISVKKRIE